MLNLNSLTSGNKDAVTVTMLSEEDNIPSQLKAGDYTKILVLGDLELQPTPSEWKALIAQMDKVFLHGRKAFKLFISPYIEIDGAMEKTVYCPEAVWVDGMVASYAEEALLKGTKIHIWIHNKLEPHSSLAKQ